MRYEVWTSYYEKAVIIRSFKKEDEAIEFFIRANHSNEQKAAQGKARGRYWVQFVWVDKKRHIRYETIRHSHIKALNKASSCQ